MNSQDIVDILHSFSISPRTGFLPESHPILSLAHVDENFEKLETFCNNLTRLVYTKQIRLQIRKAAEGDNQSLFPTSLDISKLKDVMELERAMLLLSIVGHVYLHGNAGLSEEPIDVVPSILSTPWCGVSDKLGRPPVLSHASVSIHNWRLLDRSAGITVDNIVLLNNIVGGIDEDWFFTVTIAIEACASKGNYTSLKNH